MKKYYLSKSDISPTEMLKGIFRRTLVYNDEIMLCHFYLEQNSEVPVHAHEQHQVGYIIKGKVRFTTEEGEFIVGEGSSYIFNSNEKHGAFMLEDSEIIDVFSPSRNDYK